MRKYRIDKYLSKICGRIDYAIDMHKCVSSKAMWNHVELGLFLEPESLFACSRAVA
jgi:hypothetical protein